MQYFRHLWKAILEKDKKNVRTALDNIQKRMNEVNRIKQLIEQIPLRYRGH